MRINKWLANSGFCSRRQADNLIKLGSVKIIRLRQGRIGQNQTAVLGDIVTNTDEVFINGKKISCENKKIYIMFNKPVGIICTTDLSKKDNIIQAVDYKDRIFPVGRLDVMTSGLILLTNDGEIVNKINKAENKFEKEYDVKVDKKITSDFIKQISSGVKILGKTTLPCVVKQIDEINFKIIIVQGWNKQIRRMCEAFGYNVVSLKRISIGNLKLGNLKSGKWRFITYDEIFE